MSAGCFVEHCNEIHGWGFFPCEYENCSFQAYSKTCLKLHTMAHVKVNKGGISLRSILYSFGIKFCNMTPTF